MLGSAFESLKLPVDRLRTELAVPIAGDPDPIAFDQCGDVAQLGFIALSLVLGRRIDASDFPSQIVALLDEFSAPDELGLLFLRRWLERALQVHERSFASAIEANDGLAELKDAPRLKGSPASAPTAASAPPVAALPTATVVAAASSSIDVPAPMPE